MDMGKLAKSLGITAGFVIIILSTLIWNIGAQNVDNKRLTIVVTFFPLFDWVVNIVNDKAIVINLTPPGMDPHDLDPTPQDLSMITSSNVFVYSGSGMEPWVPKILSTITGFHTITVAAAQGIELVKSDAGQTDPHFWLSPLSAITAIENIELAVEQVDPINIAFYRQNAQTYINRLNALHQDFIGNLTFARIRTFITFHEAFGFWRTTYNLNEVGIYGFEPQGEPSVAHMQDLVNLAQTDHITTVLASNLDDPYWCKVLADQISGKVLVLDPLEGPTLDQSRIGNYTYTGRLYYDISILKIALT